MELLTPNIEAVEMHPLAVLSPFGSTAQPWPNRLAFDIALGDDPEEARLHYELSEDEFLRIIHHPAFRKEVADHARDIRENGISFKSKARLFAETYLAEVDEIVGNREIGATIRLDAIKSVVKWAGLEPQATKNAEASTQPQFNIQINL
jgi:hypothetical protein